MLEVATSCEVLEDQRRNELAVAERQSNIDKEILKDSIQRMMQIINDGNKESIEDGILVESYLKEIGSCLEDQIKYWNSLKSLSTDED